MHENYFLALFLLILSFVHENRADGNGEIAELLTEPTQPQKFRGPMLEVFMHLPPQFIDVKSFKRSLGVHSDSPKDKREKRNVVPKRALVDVRSYEITQPATSDRRNKAAFRKFKREVEQPPSLEKPEPQNLSSSLHPEPDSILPVPDAIRSPKYTTFPVKEFDIVDIDDTVDLRRRRNDSNYDDDPQRDKRTFPEDSVDGRETTTPLPFWKRRKENPPFITGRGSFPKTSDYPPAQHRSTENARESHSLKNLDKSIQTNEISRPSQDNFYSSTNRRTYSRQSDVGSQSTPKSVYDQIDYSSKKNQNTDRTAFGRNNDNKKESIRNASPTHEQYNNRQYQYNYPVYPDRPFYPPPYPTEIVGRGVEYYHRTYEPSTGRIIYYANLPENGRSLDYRYLDSVNRNFYFNRPFMYDPYYRNYVPPYDYMFPLNYNRPMDYTRNGRSSSQAYSQLNQDWDKYPRDDRFRGAYDKGNRFNDEVKNKTYIIYDAEETIRSQSPKANYYTDGGRMSYTPPNKFQGPQVPFGQFPVPPPVDYYNRGVPLNNRFFNFPPRPVMGYQPPTPLNFANSNPNSNLRPLNSREIQLPLTTVNRQNHPPSGELDKNKKVDLGNQNK